MVRFVVNILSKDSSIKIGMYKNTHLISPQHNITNKR